MPRVPVEFAATGGSQTRREAEQVVGGLRDIGKEARESAKQLVQAELSKQEKLKRTITDLKLQASEAKRGSREQVVAAELAAKAQRELATSYGGSHKSLSTYTGGAKEATRETERLGRGALAGSGAMHSMGRSIAFASASFLGAAGFVSVIKTAIGAASDMHEQMTKTQAVFVGGGAKQVIKWSKDTATSMGIARDQALEFASTFGALLRPMGISVEKAQGMSTTLVGLASDLASFYNKDVSQALAALQSGMVGQVRPLRQFGVALSQDRIAAEAMSLGLVKASVDMDKVGVAQDRVAIAAAKVTEARRKYGEGTTQVHSAEDTLATSEMTLHKLLEGHVPKLNAAQKAQATYALVIKDTSIAQGDFARTSGGLANQQRILSAQVRDAETSVGKVLMPTVLEITKAVNKWFSNSQNVARVQKDVKQAVEILTGVIKTGYSWANNIAKAVGGWKHALELLLALKVASVLSGWARPIAGLIGAESGVGGTGLLGATGAARGLRVQLAALGRLGAVGITIPIVLKIIEEISKGANIGSTLLKYGEFPLVPAGYIAQGIKSLITGGPANKAGAAAANAQAVAGRKAWVRSHGGKSKGGDWWEFSDGSQVNVRTGEVLPPAGNVSGLPYRGARRGSAAGVGAASPEAIINAYAGQFGLDPAAVIAYMMEESGGRWGAKGDFRHGKPTSFGPFQMHRGGELGSHTPDWAMSPEGLIAGMMRMAQRGVRGKTGREALMEIYTVFGKGTNNRAAYERALRYLLGGGGGMDSTGRQVQDPLTTGPGLTVGASGYANPLRGGHRTTGRTDMGKDYGGTGPIYSIGTGVVLEATYSEGWSAKARGAGRGGYVSVRLTDGPRMGWTFYVAEDIRVLVKKGDPVDSTTQIAFQLGAIEMGWAGSPSDKPQGLGTLSHLHGTAAHGGDPGSHRTPEGKDFFRFVSGLGDTPGPGGGRTRRTVIPTLSDAQQRRLDDISVLRSKGDDDSIRRAIRQLLDLEKTLKEEEAKASGKRKRELHDAVTRVEKELITARHELEASLKRQAAEEKKALQDWSKRKQQMFKDSLDQWAAFVKKQSQIALVQITGALSRIAKAAQPGYAKTTGDVSDVGSGTIYTPGTMRGPGGGLIPIRIRRDATLADWMRLRDEIAGEIASLQKTRVLFVRELKRARRLKTLTAGNRRAAVAAALDKIDEVDARIIELGQDYADVIYTIGEILDAANQTAAGNTPEGQAAPTLTYDIATGKLYLNGQEITPEQGVAQVTADNQDPNAPTVNVTGSLFDSDPQNSTTPTPGSTTGDGGGDGGGDRNYGRLPESQSSEQLGPPDGGGGTPPGGGDTPYTGPPQNKGTKKPGDLAPTPGTPTGWDRLPFPVDLVNVQAGFGILGAVTGDLPQTSAVPYGNPIAFQYWKNKMGSRKQVANNARQIALALLADPAALPTPWGTKGMEYLDAISGALGLLSGNEDVKKRVENMRAWFAEHAGFNLPNQIPKFGMGGWAAGVDTGTDYVTARVRGGELMLTPPQQQRLASLLGIGRSGQTTTAAMGGGIVMVVQPIFQGAVINAPEAMEQFARQFKPYLDQKVIEMSGGGKP